MASVVFHAFQQFQKEKEIRLFKSENPDYKDGMQLRDFIYVKDAVEYVMYFLKIIIFQDYLILEQGLHNLLMI